MITLPPRQIELLGMLWSGLSREQAASRISRSLKTVEYHLRQAHLITKTDSDMMACKWALRRKLIKL
jgi:DNA-binding NarL/FixJ family response regulator